MTRHAYAVALALCERGPLTTAALIDQAACTEPTVRAALRRLQAVRIAGRCVKWAASAWTWECYRACPAKPPPAPRPYRSALAAVRAVLREGNASAAEIARRGGYHVHTIGRILRRLEAKGEVILHLAGPKSRWVLTARRAA